MSLADDLRDAEASFREASAVAEEKRETRNALIHEAREQGWSLGKIADAMGVSRSRVAQIAK